MNCDETNIVCREDRCPISEGNHCEFVSIGFFPDKSGHMGPQEILRCRHCGVGITSPPLPDVSVLYEQRASQDFQPDTAGLARRVKQIAFRRSAKALLRQLPRPIGRLLDFGCGSGLFTRCLGDVLIEGEVVGSDFHSRPPPELMDRAYCPQSELGTKNGSFDVVMAMHVLEHDDNAADLLARIASMVRPGGTVVLEVPNIDCVWAGLFGSAWDAWYVPYHRTHFNQLSLINHIKATNLEVLEFRPVSVPTMGRTFANLCGMANTLPFLLVGAVFHPIQWIGERLSGRPSALRVIARRR